ncbi:MAG: DUF4189 domain-containing protein [Hyphomicrobiaceae bacterium]
MLPEFSRLSLSAIGLLFGLATGAAHAAGALAIGETNDVSKDGYAYGNAVNARSRDEATQLALERCQNYQGAPEAVKQCKVVTSFLRECYAIALDPEAGTPGAGWAIGVNLEAARKGAVAACEKTAGPGRQGKCKVDSSFCDRNDSGVDKR